MYEFSSSYCSVYHQKLQTDAQHGMVFGYGPWSPRSLPHGSHPKDLEGMHLALGKVFLNGAFGEHPKLFWKEYSIIILDYFSVKFSMLYIYVQHISLFIRIHDVWICCIFCMDHLYTMCLSIPNTVTVSFLGFNHLHDHCRSDLVGKELTSNFPTPESLGLPSRWMMTGLEGGTILLKMTYIDGNLRASPLMQPPSRNRGQKN